MTYEEAVRIAIECLRAHATAGSAGVFWQAADALEESVSEAGVSVTEEGR